MQAQKRATPDPELATDPIRPEALAARYVGRWSIYRAMHADGTHRRWVADSCEPASGGPERITAGDIDSLAKKLAAVER